jgi:prolyl 4-hydroxylase
MISRSLFRMRSIIYLILCVHFSLAFGNEATCSLQEDQRDTQDPNLKLMTYNLGDGINTFLAYVPPHVSTFYQDSQSMSSIFHPVRPRHNGFGAKFINLSNRGVNVFWEAQTHDFDKDKAVMIRHVPAFSAKGTSTYPGHSFVFSFDDGTFLQRFIADPSKGSLMAYDPYYVHDDEESTRQKLEQDLTIQEQSYYWKWRKTLLFDTFYRSFTGRSYLATYPRRQPNHFMWPAQYFNQQHWVSTRETHFRSSSSEWLNTTVPLQLHSGDTVSWQNHRDPIRLNLTLTVVSCEPRVLEIRDFMSPHEVDHIMELSQRETLKESKLGDEKISRSSSSIQRVRTSRNSWLRRDQSPIVDAIYRRAADIMRIDEALMRPRASHERIQIPMYHKASTNLSIAEQLQLVHYGPGQEYQTHHDFAYAPLTDVTDAARFATLLLYLNEDMEGGETSFPKFSNAHTFLELKVKPEIGKAVLFYNQLPDGNMDELSQHRAHAVRKGNKWLINLWVWDPVSNP